MLCHCSPRRSESSPARPQRLAVVELDGGPEEVMPLWTVCQAQSCTRAGRAGTERSQDERGSALYQQPCCCRYIRSTFAGHAMGLQHPSWYSVLQAYPWKGGVHPCVPFVLLLRQEPCCREVFDLQADLQSSLVPVAPPTRKYQPWKRSSSFMTGTHIVGILYIASRFSPRAHCVAVRGADEIVARVALALFRLRWCGCGCEAV